MNKVVSKRRIAFLMPALLVFCSLAGCEKNADGGFNYTFTPEQFERAKQDSYLFSRLVDADTGAYKYEFIKSTKYNDIDEDGIPRALVVSVDKELYESSELMNSFW